MSGVTIIAHITEGEVSPTYHVVGEGARLFVIDDNHPGDRVFEWLNRSPESVIAELMPDGTEVGSNQDARHAAIRHLVESGLDGKSHLSLVTG